MSTAPKPPSPSDVQEFYDCLKRHANGHASAKTARQLRVYMALGRNYDRTLRALANAARAQGFLICSGNSGYWLPSSSAEIDETIGRMISQGQDMIRSAKRIKKLRDQHFGSDKPLPAIQMSLL